MVDLLNTSDFAINTNTSRPDYTCEAFQEMAPRWSMVNDLRAGLPTIRAKRMKYLPKFEAESLADWNSRVLMTFPSDHYVTTLMEHAGLVFAVPPKLGDDVPQQIRDLCEDIDGEGNNLDVFLQAALTEALHLGHVVLYTDYPTPDTIKTARDEQLAQSRPYVTIYKASDVLSPQFVAVGGVKVLVQIMFRESRTTPDGEFGHKQCTWYREIRQQVTYDEFTGRALSLGAITWRAWEAAEPAQGTEMGVADAGSFTPRGEGTIVGPTRICARIVYGGEKIAPLHSRPHLLGLGYSSIEETQVTSDYAKSMHTCNVLTPVFIGRNTGGDPSTQTVQMGQGIDIPLNGDAKFLEPSGAALSSTRQRIQDIRAEMRRQGATTDDATGKVMTAAEAKLYAKQRNAKLARAAQSLQDATEGVFADMAAFINVSKRVTIEGGSIAINQDFAGSGIDPAYLTVLVAAYKEGALPLDALMYALEKGLLPEDFQSEEAALRLIADAMAKQDAAAEMAQHLAANPQPIPQAAIIADPVPPVAA